MSEAIRNPSVEGLAAAVCTAACTFCTATRRELNGHAAVTLDEELTAQLAAGCCGRSATAGCPTFFEARCASSAAHGAARAADRVNAAAHRTEMTSFNELQSSSDQHEFEPIVYCGLLKGMRNIAKEGEYHSTNTNAYAIQ